MKTRTTITISFVVGALLSSIVWLGVVWWIHFKSVTAIVMTRQLEASAGKVIFQYIDNPSTSNRARLAFMATNLVEDLPGTVDAIAEQYPHLSMPTRVYWKPLADQSTQYMLERRKAQNKTPEHIPESRGRPSENAQR